MADGVVGKSPEVGRGLVLYLLALFRNLWGLCSGDDREKGSLVTAPEEEREKIPP
ncbi:MAG: hypothetical protein ACE5I0_08900 [Candidatus Binatia bacterium]